MPFTNFVHLTQASSGAPTLNGVNGSMNAVIKWGLAQVAWANEYTNAGTFEDVMRPATGNRFRHYIGHNSALSGAAQRVVIRGCENASDASTLIDPFPTVAMVAATSCNTLASTTAAATARNYHFIAWDTGFIFAGQVSGTANRWQLYGFGDLYANVDADTWGTAIWGVRVSTNNTTITSPSGSTLIGSGGLDGTYWARSIDGTVKSSRGSWYVSGSNPGNVSGLNDASNCYLGKIRKERVGFNCNASQSTTAGSVGLSRRGFFPQMWSGLYSGIGTVTDGDTFTDPSGATYIMLGAGADSISYIIQTSNDWTPPTI